MYEQVNKKGPSAWKLGQQEHSSYVIENGDEMHVVVSCERKANWPENPALSGLPSPLSLTFYDETNPLPGHTHSLSLSLPPSLSLYLYISITLSLSLSLFLFDKIYLSVLLYL